MTKRRRRAGLLALARSTGHAECRSEAPAPRRRGTAVGLALLVCVATLLPAPAAARWWTPDGTWNFDIVNVFVPSTMVQGESTTLTVSIKNVGHELGTVSVYLGVQRPVGDKEYFGPRKIFDIAVGETKTLSWLYTPSAGPGQYVVDFDVYNPPESHMFDTTGFVHNMTVTAGPQSDPTANQSSPSSDAVTVEVGTSQTFVAMLDDVDCDLNSAEWYRETEPPSGAGILLKGDPAPEGCSASTTWTGTFPTTGTFELIVIVFDDRNDGAHVGRTSWVVTVTSAGGGGTPTECTESADGTTLRFSGYDWKIKTGNGLGPWLNNWRRENVRCEADGLHLQIAYRGGMWTAAEVTTLTYRGPGHYEFKVSGTPLDSLPHTRVVLGLFNYPPAEFGNDRDGTNEIDIEFSKWGDPNREPGQYVVFPADPRLKGQYASSRFFFDQTAPSTTHRFNWQSDQIIFESFFGTQQVAHRYAPLDYQSRIPQVPLPIHINLWLYRGPDEENPVPDSAIVGATTEIVIQSVSWQPAATPARFRLPALPLGLRSTSTLEPNLALISGGRSRSTKLTAAALFMVASSPCGEGRSRNASALRRQPHRGWSPVSPAT